jgi:dTDP-4-dehydrorhamnose reductase
MLGHKLWQVLAPGFDTFVTTRRGFDAYEGWGLFDRAHTVAGVSADSLETVAGAIASVRPDVVVNCIGIVKQSDLAKDPVPAITVNSLFPHQVARLCRGQSIRLIHISTDCVYSGLKGNYAESDPSDAEDLYGRTKFLGEVDYQGSLTLRTSMIGRELETANGLIEWFLGQRGAAVNGYARAVFSGFTTHALAEIIAMVTRKHPDMRGVWHVAATPISKFDLLLLVNQVYRLGITVARDESVIIDRSLNADRFHRATGFVPPDWRDMIEQLYRDPTPYSRLRR